MNLLKYPSFILVILIFGLSCISKSTHAQVNLDNGLVAYFKLDSNAADSSISAINGSGNNLTHAQGIQCSSNSAYTFNGSSSKIVCGTHNRGITNTVSISAWVKTSATSGHLFIVEKYNWSVDRGYYLAIKDGIPLIGARNTTGSGGHTWNANQLFNVSDGQWHHILGVVSQNNLEIWVDGILKATGSLSASTPDLTTSYNLNIGYYYKASSTGNHNYFNGTLDEIRMYNRTLNTAEITALKNGRTIRTTVSLTVCDSLQSPSGMHTWYSSGVYQDTLLSTCSTDSIQTINLTVLNSSDTQLTITSCGDYTSPSGQFVWGLSGVYQETLPNSLGCDSVVTYNVTINQNSSATINASACGSYVSASGVYNWTSTGVYQDTIPNSLGCDSILTYDLTILQNSMATITASTCDSYASPSGLHRWSASGTYTDVIPNGLGCDSVITINLQVTHTDTTVSQNGFALHAVSDSDYTYQWIDCVNGNTPISGANNFIFTPDVSGIYAVEITHGSCFKTSDCFSMTNVGVAELNPLEIEIYPNPAIDFLNVLNPKEQELNIRVIDLSGKIIIEKQTVNSRLMIDVSVLSSGVYLVNATSIAQSFTQPLIIQ